MQYHRDTDRIKLCEHSRRACRLREKLIARVPAGAGGFFERWRWEARHAEVEGSARKAW